MRIKLNLLERALLFDFLTLPNSVYHISVRVPNVRKLVAFTDVEIQEGEIKFADNSFHRNPGKEFDVEFEFKDKEFWMIHNQLRRLDKQYKFEEKYILLYNKFVIPFMNIKQRGEA